VAKRTNSPGDLKMKIIRLPEVVEITGLSRSTIYSRMSQDGFPKSISLGDRAAGWIESEIEEWIESRIRLSRQSQSS